MLEGRIGDPLHTRWARSFGERERHARHGPCGAHRRDSSTVPSVLRRACKLSVCQAAIAKRSEEEVAGLKLAPFGRRDVGDVDRYARATGSRSAEGEFPVAGSLDVDAPSKRKRAASRRPPSRARSRTCRFRSTLRLVDTDVRTALRCCSSWTSLPLSSRCCCARCSRIVASRRASACSPSRRRQTLRISDHRRSGGARWALHAEGQGTNLGELASHFGHAGESLE